MQETMPPFLYSLLSFQTLILIILILVERAAFSQNSLVSSMNPERNSNLRVMATPQWPVPYYQRAFRHPARLDKNEGDLGYIAVGVNDGHVMIAKELLKLEGKGYVVEAVEQHYDIDNYMTSFKDSSQFSEAYTDDLLDCLGAAREQDVKLLKENDFSDIFN